MIKHRMIQLNDIIVAAFIFNVIVGFGFGETSPPSGEPAADTVLAINNLTKLKTDAKSKAVEAKKSQEEHERQANINNEKSNVYFKLAKKAKELAKSKEGAEKDKAEAEYANYMKDAADFAKAEAESNEKAAREEENVKRHLDDVVGATLSEINADNRLKRLIDKSDEIRSEIKALNDLAERVRPSKKLQLEADAKVLEGQLGIVDTAAQEVGAVNAKLDESLYNSVKADVENSNPSSEDILTNVMGRSELIRAAVEKSAKTSDSTLGRIKDPNGGYSNGKLPSVEALTEKYGVSIPMNTDISEKNETAVWRTENGTVFKSSLEYTKMTPSQQTAAFKRGELSFLQNGQWVQVNEPTWDKSEKAWNLNTGTASGSSNNSTYHWKPGSSLSSSPTTGLYKKSDNSSPVYLTYYSEPIGQRGVLNANPDTNGVAKSDGSRGIIQELYIPIEAASRLPKSNRSN